jgi:SAM-dependent methyltransferase
VPPLCLFAERRLEERTVGAVAQALRDTQLAFDQVAPTYDASNAQNRTLCGMRARTLRLLESHVPSGARVLDLGCGPGADVEYLSARGYEVTAIDWSPAMVREAQRRVRAAGHRDLPIRHLGIHELDRLDAGVFDAALSNLGPLNCVPNLAAAAQLIARRLRPGGVLIASVIGRVCPWEIAVYAARRNWPRLRVRFGVGGVAVPLETGTVWTHYYSPRVFERVFGAAGFTRIALRGLGVLVPPPYMQAFSDRHRTLVACLQRLEDLTASWPGFRACGDHFLIGLRKS